MVHEEAARIARGPVTDVKDINVDDFDALFIPGGFGAAKNLCDFAIKGNEADIDPDVTAVIQAFHGAQKPIGAVCIAPALLALSLKKGTLTIGSDADTATAINSLGASHQDSPVTQAVIDPTNKIATAPAYMCDAPIHEVAQGIEAAVTAVLGMCAK